MPSELKVLHIVLVLLYTLSSSTYNSNGNWTLEGSAADNSIGDTILTNTKKHSCGQTFNNESIPIKDSSFSFHFLFGIVPEHTQSGSHSMSFVISPTAGLPGASSDQYLELFNETTNGKSSNHVIAIELDIQKDQEFGDIDDNHVGININGLTSVVSASAGYYDDKDGIFRNLSLISGKVMRLSIVYSHPDQQLNVTLFPAEIPVPPRKPLLSLNRDLSPYFLEEMYYGYTASTGSIGAFHYMLSSYATPKVENPTWEFIVVPTLPPYPKKSSDRTKKILAVCLTLAVFAVFVASGICFVFYTRHKKVKEVLEEWEIQYGPHRFAYKELLNATKDFKEKQLLGKGGFGMSEFLAEISTIGRLRHPNLVRLLGYCRHKENLYLVYDFMPNGSLDKYLDRNENQERLTWEQRFKIIKDVASALLHLHQEWGLDPQTSRVAGTFGYIAPELLRTGRATTSTDVYAFGLVMLEVVCGKRMIERRAPENEEVLVDWILELWESGKLFDAAEESIRQEQNRGEIELLLKLGLLCAHHTELIRPNMSAVMQILNGVSQLPDNLLDVVRAENLRGMPETSIEVLLGLNLYSVGTMTLTNSFLSHGR
ncbi:hypothetical protein AXX17_AT3G54150 [Arabidopsis thaliana]|uniref:Protein kinase domain-containing protein n=1 Tax=Arabidopsis thaliana TaxID=3702 RepID=A0A178V803_ARATH|nr:hypothetical protein AXX17_AT3G54150 [Arabidopsis thaliana]